MTFWESVNEGLKKYAREGWDAVKEGAIKSKKRYRIHTLQKKAEKLLAKLGGIVYEMARPPYENPLSRQDVIETIEEIKKVEEEIAALEKEIEEMKEQGPSSEKNERGAEEKK